jgi:uncharacterized protein with GYD domain
MAKYMITGSYTVEGLKGLFKDKATGRVAAVRQALEGLGGRLESLHFVLGNDDVILIADLPDITAASALSLVVSATGLLRTRTVALMTPEEADKALATSVQYRGPGA